MTFTERAIRAIAWVSRATPPFQGRQRLLRWLHPCEERYEGVIRGVVRTADGLRFLFDTSDFIEWELFFNGRFEPETTDLLSRLIRPGWTCVDAGANIGVLSAVMARAAGPGGVVYAFEPQPAIAERLETNLRLNGISNVRLERVCLGAKEGTAAFFVPRKGISNVGQSSLYLDHHPRLQTGDLVRSEVQIITFDEFVRSTGLESLDFMKIDVEGAEIPLLQGAAEALARWRPVIFIEANAVTQTLSGSSVETLLDHIERLGYTLYTAAGTGEWRPFTAADRSDARSDPNFMRNVLAARDGLPEALFASSAGRLPSRRTA